MKMSRKDHMSVKLPREKRDLEETVRQRCTYASSCPCGFLVATVCDYGYDHSLGVWVSSEEIKTRDIITAMKYSMEQDPGGIDSISFIHNCPHCDTAIGFMGKKPFIIPGMHHVESSIGGYGRVEMRSDPQILYDGPDEDEDEDEDEDDGFDPFRDFEWQD